MQKRIFSLLLALAMLCTSVFVSSVTVFGAETTYYVDAVNGNDSTGDGSSQNPWKTISKAASVMQSGDTCRIRTGIYRETVTPANSGTASGYITFEADTAAEVTISGADLVTTPWTVHDNSVYKTTKALAMGDWKNQVFVDGVSMNLARWPNAGTDPMNPVFLTSDTGTDNSKILDSELTQPDGYWNGAAVITMDKTRWSMASGKVTSFTKGRLNLTDIYTHGLGVESGFGSPYYLIGKLEALDSANEWYYDRGTTTLYLHTPTSDSPANHIVEVKARNNAFNLANKSYIRIKGVNLFAASIDASSANYCDIDGIDAKYPSHYDFGHSGSEHFFKTSGILLGGTGNVLQNSTLAYSPGNLVTVSGQENKVINNVMHDAAYGPAYTCSTGCIWVDGTRQLISHNTLYNTVRNCISGSPVNSRIQYNHGYNAMTLLDDGGAIYLTAIDGDGTEIHHNVFHDVKSNPPHFISGGIYLDFSSWDFNIYNNLTYNTNKFGVFFHSYNEFLHAYNNTFYEDSIFRMKDDGGALDAYGVRVINNIAYDGVSLARGFGIVEKNNFKTGDPLFASPAAGEFQLQAASSAIDTGAEISGITNGYSGGAPDIGAFESGAPIWSAGHNFDSPPKPSFTTANIQYNTLLENGFFERETTTLGGWTKTDSKTAVIERSGNDALSSRHAWSKGLKLGSGADGVEQTVTGLKTNTEYELRGFGRAGISSQEIKLGVKNYGGEEKSEGVTSTSWTKKKIRFTTGANDTSVTVFISKATTGGYAYADDVTLMEVDPEAPPELEFDNTIISDLGVTVVNDRDLGTGLNQFEYVGNWGTNPSNMDAYKGDVTYTNTANDYYQVRFEGEKIRIYTEMDAHFGMVGVSIDGGPETLVDLYSSEPKDKTLVYESPALPSGQHILKVRVTGTKNESSNGTWVVADRVEIAAATKTVNDRETGTGLYQFEYVGNWGTNPSNLDAYNGDVTYTNSPDAYYQVRFEGKQIGIYTEMDAHFGMVGVSIDGGAETLVDLYSDTPLDKTLVYKSPELPAGQHILKVRVTGTKNASSNGIWVVADRVDIVLGGTPSTEPEYGELYSEDFESTAVGGLPAGWTASIQNPGSVTADAVGNHRLTLVEPGNGTKSSAEYSFNPIQTKFGIDLRVMAEQTGKTANFLTLKDSTGVKVAELLFDLDYASTGSRKIARRTPDGNWSNLMEYNANQWYDIHVDVDLQAGLYDVFIDDVQVAENIPVLAAADNIAQYAISCYEWSKGTYHVDDLRISGPIVEEEPEFEEILNENFEATPVGAVPANWTAGTDNPVSVTQDASGNHRMTVVETGNGTTSAATVNFGPLKDKLLVDVKVMAEQTGESCNFLTLRDSEGARVIELLFDQDYDNTGRRNIARRTADGNWSSIMQYSASQWYSVHVEVDVKEALYSLSIDGVKIFENLPTLKAASNIVQYAFAPHRYDIGAFHLDDLVIAALVSETPNTAPAFDALEDKTVTAGQLLAFTAAAQDAEGDVLVYSAANLPEGAQLDATTGAFSWTPGEDQAGTYTITLMVSDGKLTDDTDVIITVNEPELNLEVLLEEDFESMTIGAAPEGWTVENLGAGSITVAQIADGANSSNKALKIQRTTMNKTLFAKRMITPASGTVSIDVRMRNSQANTLMNGPILRDGTGKDAIYMGFQRNGKFGVLNTGWQDLSPYAANQWYDVHIEANTDTDTYDLYIDGTQVLDNKAFRNAVSDISEITFSPYSWDNGTVHYDNIAIRVKTLAPPNTAPVLDIIGDRTVDEAQLITFTATATDTEEDSLVYSAVNLPEGASFDSDSGVFAWTPGYEQAGSYSITIEVSDGKLTDTETFNITVNNANRTPEIQPIEEKVIDEGSALEFTVSAQDPDSDPLILTAANLPEGALFEAASGLFTWTPGYEEAGEYLVNVTASDGDLITEATFKIVVGNVTAQKLTEALKNDVQALNINIISKKLLQKKLDLILSQLNKEHYKVAMISLKAFMLEVKLLEPRIISEVDAERLLDASLDICLAIKADAQGKDSTWIDKKVEDIIDKIKDSKKGDITNAYNTILQEFDDLINTMRD